MKSMLSRICATLAVLAYVVLAVSVKANAQAPDSPAAPQATVAFNFTATDLAGEQHTLQNYLDAGKFVILEWFNPDCPYIQKYHAPGGTNTSFDEALAYARKHDVVWLMINSNAPGRQGSGEERNKQAVKDYGIDVPLMLDPTGKIGRAYGASSTPQIFLINPKGEILYDGGIDDTKVNTDKPGVNYVVNAIKQALAGEAVDPSRTPHPGCSVKYPQES